MQSISSIILVALALLDSLAAPAIGAAPSAAKPGEVITLKNGDQLHGTLSSINPETGIHWKHLSGDVLKFAPGEAAEIDFATPASLNAPRGRSVVKLTNGDSLVGEIESLDQTRLTLNTSCAGSITIKRMYIERIKQRPERSKSAKVIYSGPIGMEGWLASGREAEAEGWTYRGGAFYSGASGAVLARNLNLPDSAVIEFDLAWQVGATFAFAFYADTTEAYKGNFYGLHLTLPGSFSILRSASGIQQMQPRSEITEEHGEIPFQDKKKAHFRLLVSRTAKTITLLADGALLGRWVEPGEFASAGSAIRFATHGPSRVRISDIRIMEWDGREKTNPEIPRNNADQVMTDDNKGKASGVIESITHHEIVLMGPYGKLKIPMNRVTQICFSSLNRRIAPSVSGDVQVRLLDGSETTGAVKYMDASHLIIRHEHFGTLSLARSALKRLEFSSEQNVSPSWEEDNTGNNSGISLLLLRNGDRLQGELVGATMADGVQWRAGGDKGRLTFPCEDVTAIIVGRKERPLNHDEEGTQVTLVNGDNFAGSNATLKEGVFSLATPYAGAISAAQNSLVEIIPGTRGTKLVYSGPTEVDNWKQEAGKQSVWNYRNGALYSSGVGTIGRELPLPETAKIEFDWSWSQPNPQLLLSFYTDQLSSQRGNAYLLYLNLVSISLQRLTLAGNTGVQDRILAGGEDTRPALSSEATKTHVTLLVDKSEKTIALFLDGKLVREWKDRIHFSGGGTGLVFEALNQTPNRISNLHVSRWDGSRDNEGADGSEKQDTVQLANSDRLSGQIVSLDDREAELLVHGKQLKVPLDRVTALRFSNGGHTPPPVPSGQVRVALGSNGSFVSKLERIENKEFIGSSSLLGKIRVMLDHVYRIDFYAPEETEASQNPGKTSGHSTLPDTGRGVH